MFNPTTIVKREKGMEINSNLKERLKQQKYDEIIKKVIQFLKENDTLSQANPIKMEPSAEKIVIDENSTTMKAFCVITQSGKPKAYLTFKDKETVYVRKNNTVIQLRVEDKIIQTRKIELDNYFDYSQIESSSQESYRLKRKHHNGELRVDLTTRKDEQIATISPLAVSKVQILDFYRKELKSKDVNGTIIYIDSEETLVLCVEEGRLLIQKVENKDYQLIQNQGSWQLTKLGQKLEKRQIMLYNGEYYTLMSFRKGNNISNFESSLESRVIKAKETV